MSSPSTGSRVSNWIDHRLPIISFAREHLIEYPAPRNLNYWWNFGSLAGIALVLQIVTGIVLAMAYTAHTSLAFDSVERIMRDVNFGWLLRYAHANGASMFFIIVFPVAPSSLCFLYLREHGILWSSRGHPLLESVSSQHRHTKLSRGLDLHVVLLP